MIRAYNKAFVNVKFMLPVIGINFSDFNIWLQETDVPYTLIRNKSIYVEKLAFGEIVRCHAEADCYRKWLRHTRKDNVSRSLTKTDKIKVAADQKWICARCKEVLPATFEVDHVEEFCLRGQETMLQALCPTCHREKTYDDINIANPFTGRQSLRNLTSDEQNRNEMRDCSGSNKTDENVFSKYFHH